MIVFIEVTPRWPADSSPIRACSKADRLAQSWGGEIWAAAIFDPGTLAIALFNGAIGSAVEPSVAPMSLAAESLVESYPDAQTARWEGAAYRLWVGDVSGAGITAEQISQGRVSRFEKDGGALKLSLDPAGEAGAAKVLDLEYAGTGGAEGSVNLKGKPKPWIFGHAQNVEPVLIDEDNSVYQFSGYGPIQAVDALYERGSSFGASVGDYANYAALVAATIPAGRWATCLTQGLVRLGAPQYGLITGDVKGDYHGSVQRRRPGAIIQRIAGHRSISAIDVSSLNALDAFAATLPAGGNISLVLSEQTTFIDLARKLASGFNAQAGFDLMGRLITPRIVVGTPNFTIHSQGKTEPVAVDFIEADTPPPYKQIVMSGEVCWRVHDLANDIAFYATPVDRGLYDDDETYREGDIVDLGDGSRWFYVNPAPTAGNQPPTWPETSNAWWTNLTPPLNRGKIFVQPSAPSAEESTGGDTWQDANGRYWTRREDNHLSIGGNRLMIGGNLLTMTWTANPSQPVRDGIDAALQTALAASAAAAELALDAQATADGKVQSFYAPTAPAAEGVGDLWFDTDDGNKQYRWSGSEWVPVQDSKIGDALTAAAGAQATADGKVTTFFGPTMPTAEAVGDLWFNEATGYLKRWSGAAWLDVSNIGATTAQLNDIAQALSDAANAQATADGKVDTYYQAAPPGGASIGDLWFDTDDGNKLYRHDGADWVAARDSGIGDALTAAAGAQATADGKVTTFIGESAPTAEAVGDLWFKASTGELRRWSGSAWGAPLVDLTAGNTPRHEPASSSKAFTANYLGALDPGSQLPATFVIKRFLGTTDVSGSATWSIETQGGISGGTVTVASGLVTIPSGCTIPASGTIKVKSSRNGFDIVSDIGFSRIDAAAPNTGGGGGGTVVTDNTLNDISTTSMTQISDTMTVRTGATGRIDFGGSLGVVAAYGHPPGLFSTAAIWKYRVAGGGSYTDVGSEIASSEPANMDGPKYTEDMIEYYDSTNGSINVAASQTGLSANTDYEVQLHARRTSSSPAKTLSFSGTVSATGS